jgi:hypothetical protein
LGWHRSAAGQLLPDPHHAAAGWPTSSSVGAASVSHPQALQRMWGTRP